MDKSALMERNGLTEEEFDRAARILTKAGLLTMNGDEFQMTSSGRAAAQVLPDTKRARPSLSDVANMMSKHDLLDGKTVQSDYTNDERGPRIDLYVSGYHLPITILLQPDIPPAVSIVAIERGVMAIINNMAKRQSK